jgi:hypothetical protein
VLYWLHYKVRLYVLQLRKWRTESRLEKLFNRARAEGKTEAEIFTLRREYYEELIAPGDAIHQLHHDALAREADAYLIPLPEGSDHPEDDTWEKSITGLWRLSLPERQKLLAKIRAERRERWEEVSRWIPIITAVTGLLGVAVAILAILTK